MASGFPPIAGILTAVVGGVLTTWLGSAPLTIKGPAAGLIVIALGAVQDLGGGDAMLGYHRALATIVVAGLIQIIFSVLRAGVLSDVFPPSVVHGMLAAIGVIIISKQSHTLLGVAPAAKSPFALLAEIPHSLMNVNPEIALIGLLSLCLLFSLPLVKNKWAKRIPAPMLVLFVAVPLGMLFDLEHLHLYSFNQHDFEIGPRFLVTLPSHLLSAITMPDFSAVFSGTSIKYIIMFALVGSIESLLSARAVDALAPEGSPKGNMNKDLFATGFGNLLSGMIGGLPMISEIVRSSANINNGAKSGLSNFFHGVFLLLFVAFLPGLLHEIPLAALAAMLIYTGTRLASPRELRKTLHIGSEQLTIFMTTLIVTLATDLLVGVGAGILLKIVLHLVNGAPLGGMFKPQIETIQEGGTVTLRVHQCAVFTNYLALRKALNAHTNAKRVVIDLSETLLVDHTVSDKLHHLQQEYSKAGRTLELHGLDQHTRLSQHHLSAAKRRKRIAATTSI